MPDLWMDVDTALAEVPVNIMPLLDATDFKTIEDAVAYNAAGLALRWHFVTTGGVYTVTSVTPTTGGNYDWTDQGDSGIYTIEIPASGGASINNDTEGFGWFTGVATGVLPWRGPTIGFRAAGLNNLLIDDAYSAARGLAGTALPAAAADAAGGLIISDAGGLDADAQLVTKINDILTDTGTTLQAEVDGIQADTEDIQTRLPAALVSGRIDASVGAMAAGVVTAAAVATDAIDADAIAADAVTEIQAGLSTLTEANVRSAVGLASANLDTQLDALPTAAEVADAVLDEDMTAHQTQGSLGQAIGDPGVDTDTIFGLVNTNLNATISSRASQTSVDDLPTNAELAAALAAADDAILAAIAALNNLSQADVRTAVGLASANLDTQLDALPTAAENADAVWDETLADHLGAGSTGAALNAAGAAGDPWSTALPGAYGAGTAGKIVGDNLNATISSRATQTSVDDLPTNAELATALAAADDAILAAIAALNDLSSADVTAAVPTAIQNADALLKRDWTAVTGEASRSALNALRFIRNKFSTVVTPGSVTVYKEDDTTVAYTKSLTTNAAAEPIVEG